MGEEDSALNSLAKEAWGIMVGALLSRLNRRRIVKGFDTTERKVVLGFENLNMQGFPSTNITVFGLEKKGVLIRVAPQDDCSDRLFVCRVASLPFPGVCPAPR